jgi:hypothetical protein
MIPSLIRYLIKNFNLNWSRNLAQTTGQIIFKNFDQFFPINDGIIVRIFRIYDGIDKEQVFNSRFHTPHLDSVTAVFQFEIQVT